MGQLREIHAHMYVLAKPGKEQTLEEQTVDLQSSSAFHSHDFHSKWENITLFCQILMGA